MTLARPEFVWLILTVPLAALLMRVSDRMRLSRLSKHSGPLMAQAASTAINPRARAAKRSLLLVALALLAITAAGPSYGTALVPESDAGVDIMLVVDVSRSMLASDILPSRLEATRLSIQDLTRSLRGERIGLVAFSGTAFTQCPLTSDYSAFLLYVRDLSVASIPRGGTNLEQALAIAAESLGNEGDRPRVIILLSDGENHEGDPVAAARLAADHGIAIYTVGVGTPEGEIIPVVDEYGRQSYIQTDDGRIVKSELDEALMQEIARVGGGNYRRAVQTDFGLTSIYAELITSLRSDAIDSMGVSSTDTGMRMRNVPVDRYYIPLFIVIVLLSLDLLVAERRRDQ